MQTIYTIAMEHIDSMAIVFYKPGLKFVKVILTGSSRWMCFCHSN